MSNIENLFPHLLEKTKKGDVPWEPLKGNKLRVNFSRSSIEIEKFVDNDILSESYEIKIFNSRGDCIESLDSDFNHVGLNTLKELYDAAYAKAFEVQQTFKDIFDGLKGA